jgi:isopenicillin N synthase-like dioxygenase
LSRSCCGKEREREREREREDFEGALGGERLRIWILKENLEMGVEDPVLVQQLANLQIDPNFVLPPEHRPTRKYNDYTAAGEQVPVIDLSSLRRSNKNPGEEEGEEGSRRSSLIHEKLVEQVGKACEEWGFFQVINHGISLSLLDEVETNALNFFALPLEEKSKVRRTFENALGYYDSELTKNVRDWKEVFDFTTRGVLEPPVASSGNKEQIHVYTNQWPEYPPTFRAVCEKWSKSVEGLAFELLGLISESLGLPATYFHKYWLPDDSNFIRLNYYPKCPAPNLALGVSRHKDGGGLTVLVQDEVGGLEVRRKDGKWIGIKPQRDAFVINVGDLFQVWSNDKYKSVEHRVVVNENKARFSVPFFFNPSQSTNVAPVPQLLGENLPLYRQYNWGEFLNTRKGSNFKNLGVENVQIYHFAINRDENDVEVQV